MSTEKKDEAVEETAKLANGAVAETDAAPEMAEAANKDVEHKASINVGSEDPAKTELTDEQKDEHMKAVIIQQLIEGEKELAEIVKEVEDKGFAEYVYDNDSTVEISGALFAHLINFAVAVKAHNDSASDILKKVMENTHAVYTNILDANASLSLAALDFQRDFTRKHIDLSEAGVTKSPEEIAEKNAAENIKEVPTAEKKEKKTKARGSKAPAKDTASKKATKK